jgi:hypothetical protein
LRLSEVVCFGLGAFGLFTVATGPCTVGNPGLKSVWAGWSTMGRFVLHSSGSAVLCCWLFRDGSFGIHLVWSGLGSRCLYFLAPVCL